MKTATRVLFACSMSLLQGCIYFATGPEQSFAESATKYQLSVQSVTRVTPKIERMQYNDEDTPYYSLKLVAEGRFVQHAGHSMKLGTPCLAVGLWPGCAENENKAGLFVGSIFGNCVLVGIPTICSLLVEPLCDYHERNANATSNIADIGLIGFNKYYCDVRKDATRGFKTDSTKDLYSYEIFGYAVEVDGQRLEDKDYGNGCSGTVYFKSSRPSGSRVRIRILAAPSARSDGNDGFSGMEGLEIMGTIP